MAMVSPRLRPSRDEADRIGAHLVEQLAQVQVCQMPRSLCRIAGRLPKPGVADHNFGKVVSLESATVMATASSPHRIMEMCKGDCLPGAADRFPP